MNAAARRHGHLAASSRFGAKKKAVLIAGANSTSHHRHGTVCLGPKTGQGGCAIRALLPVRGPRDREYESDHEGHLVGGAGGFARAGFPPGLCPGGSGITSFLGAACRRALTPGGSWRVMTSWRTSRTWRSMFEKRGASVRRTMSAAIAASAVAPCSRAMRRGWIIPPRASVCGVCVPVVPLGGR
jgi:hypothetical protein